VVVPPLPFVAVGVGDAVGVALVVGGDVGDVLTLGGVDPDAVAVTLPRGGASAELPHPASVTTAAQARAANVRRARVGLRIVVLASSDTHSGLGPRLSTMRVTARRGRFGLCISGRGSTGRPSS
jgi:hypothetical protein